MHEGVSRRILVNCGDENFVRTIYSEFEFHASQLIKPIIGDRFTIYSL